jgi:AraC-like DNA-binding protein
LKSDLLYNNSGKLSFWEVIGLPKHQSDNSRTRNHYNAFTYSNTTWKPHFHKSLELIYLLKGQLTLTVNDHETILRMGEAAMILSNQIHSFHVDAGTLVWVAVFSEDFVPEFASFMKDKQGNSPVFLPDEEVSALLTRELILSEPTALMRRACLYAVCDQYLKKVTLEERKTKNDILICRILDYIQEHFTEDISLEDVAAEFGYEHHYLSRLLNKSYHLRFRSIVNDYRVEAAMRELRRGEMGMTEIAMKCGFQSIRSFNEVFRASTGMSPSEFSTQSLGERLNVKKM